MPSTWTRSLVAFALCWGLAACGSDNPVDTDSDAGVDVVSDTGTADAGPIACLSTAGCNAEAPGTVCIEGECASCSDDTQCSSDAAYGEHAYCGSDGLCAVCPAGDLGCACLAGDCAEGVCTAGVCIDCEPGQLDCTCNDDGTCDVGFRCGETETCIECVAGEPGCPCDEGDVCDEGHLCVEGLCSVDPCTAGARGCPCDDGEVCDTGAGCHDDGFCYVCDADGIGCPCDTDAGCANDFVCDDTSLECRRELECDDAECGEHQLCDDADLPDGVDAECIEACEAGWIWDADLEGCVAFVAPNCTPGAENSRYAACTAQNRECVVDGDTASCGDCLAGFLDQDGTCRAVRTCADVGDDCAGLNRGCVDAGDHTDATCGACVSLYIEPASGDACVLGDLTCAPGLFSIAELCAAENRVCTPGAFDPATGSGEGSAEGSGETLPGRAECGACVAGFAENPEADDACQELASCVERGCSVLGRTCSGEPFAVCGECIDGLTPLDPADPLSACRAVLTCDDLTCGADEYCVASATGGDASCIAPSCGAGQAENSSGECVSCPVICDAETEGATGRLWLYTRGGSNDCLCETEPGYFADPSRAALPRPCDADGDGWVRRSARTFINAEDATLAANARCALRQVDSVTLRNEWLQEYELHVCGLDLVPTADLETDCEEITPVELYEPDTLDDDDAIRSLSGFFALYSNGIRGRILHAAELNPLTKACAGSRGDHNANDVTDYLETQGMDPPEGVTFDSYEFLWIQATYFLELHRGFFEPRPAEDYGTYVIAERSRCEVDGEMAFPFGYADATPTEYWRGCSRSRRPTYDATSGDTGYDFAQYTCGAESGGCPLPEPPVGDASPMVDGVPVHGLCDDIPLPPSGDFAWRGMNHASQFRCVELADDAVDSWEMNLSEVYDGDASGEYEFNRCGIACDDGDVTCASDCVGLDCLSSVEFDHAPAVPILDCQVDTAPSAGDIGFVARRFTPQGSDSTWSYEDGCIDEWEAWPQLCPGWLDPATVPGGGNPATGDGLPNDFGRLICGCGANYYGPSCEFGCANAAIDPDFDVDVGWWICPEMSAAHHEARSPDWGASFYGADGGGAGTFTLQGRIPDATNDRAPLCQTEACESGFTIR